MNNVLRPIEKARLKEEFHAAQPFRFFSIDNFMDEQFALGVAAAYPSYQSAREQGLEFNAARERLKIQITERDRFPDPVKALADALAAPAFLADLEYITGITGLLHDPEFAGAGMHLTSNGGRLDVHVDFDYLTDRALHRRLNILVYLNEKWDDNWGGHIELWDKNISRCHHSFAPTFNRCVVFETSEISFHGVKPISGPDEIVRKSFAGYYYTNEAPEGWDGKGHSTVFRPRPSEKVRGIFLGIGDLIPSSVKNKARRLTEKLRGN